MKLDPKTLQYCIDKIEAAAKDHIKSADKLHELRTNVGYEHETYERARAVSLLNVSEQMKTTLSRLKKRK